MIVGDTGTSGAPKSGNTNNAFQKELVQGEKFSSITVSSLLQNPAAHSAASSTAAFWPYANAKNREDPPSMAAIAAATVTAATAWWAVHRLLPVQTDFSCSPISMTGVPVPSMDTGQAPPAKRERGESSLQIPSLRDQQLDSKHTEAVEAQHSNIAKANTDDEKDVASTEEVHDSNHAKNRKQADRSLYGSNTPCNDSEEETAAIEKNEKGKE